jgi:hypothetical protein
MDKHVDLGNKLLEQKLGYKIPKLKKSGYLTNKRKKTNY